MKHLPTTWFVYQLCRDMQISKIAQFRKVEIENGVCNANDEIGYETGLHQLIIEYIRSTYIKYFCLKYIEFIDESIQETIHFSLAHSSMFCSYK